MSIRSENEIEINQIYSAADLKKAFAAARVVLEGVSSSESDIVLITGYCVFKRGADCADGCDLWSSSKFEIRSIGRRWIEVIIDGKVQKVDGEAIRYAVFSM